MVRQIEFWSEIGLKYSEINSNKCEVNNNSTFIDSFGFLIEIFSQGSQRKLLQAYYSL